MRRHLPILVAAAVALVWGLNFLLLKVVLGEFRVLSFAFLRFAGMIVVAWAVVLALRTPLRLQRRDRPRVLAAGLVGYSGYVLLALLGLNFTTAFSNALLIAAAPVFSVLLLAAWRVEVIGPGRAVGLLLALAGVGIFMVDQLAAGWGSAGLGDLISLAAAACYAGYTVLMKPLTTRYPAALVTAFTLSVGALPVLLLTAPDLAHQDWRLIDLGGWSLLAWSTVVPVYLAWTLWSWATGRAGVAVTNSLLYLVPVTSGLLSVAFLHESLGWTKLLGAVTVLLGLFLVSRLRRRESSPAPAVDSVSDQRPAIQSSAGSRAGGSSSPGRARPSQG